MKNNYIKKSTRYSLTIGWLYPELMSTYGDRGNILVIQKRAYERNIDVKIEHINHQTNPLDLKNVDLIFGGGAQDKEQEIVMKDLVGKKSEIIKGLIENNTPALFVCGSPQLMGKFYEPARGKKIEGLGIFDMKTFQANDNHAPRLTGNVIGKVIWENLGITKNEHHKQYDDSFQYIVGFENHGGRTYLGKNVKPFAEMIRGNGNNGEDGTEGVVYKNAIGCYFHGPLLPKNPNIADFLLEKALEVKYGEKVALKPLDNRLEIQANQMIVKKLGIEI